MAQLAGAVEAVFRSWQSPRAVEYRRLHGLDDLAGTAVTVQAMVFGNMGGTSGSGVGFTRDPATGENDLYLDFLPNAQGEDVVSGRCPVQGVVGLQESLPELYRQLRQVSAAGAAVPAMPRTSSSPCRRDASTCCNRAVPNGRRGRPSASPASRSPRD